MLFDLFGKTFIEVIDFFSHFIKNCWCPLLNHGTKNIIYLIDNIQSFKDIDNGSLDIH